MITMDKSGKDDVFKKAANDKNHLTKFISSLTETAQTDPKTKALIWGIKNLATLYTQNPEGATALFEQLSEIVTSHKDA